MLPNKEYYYFYKEQNYAISLDYVISSINSSEDKYLFLLNELNATDDFLINVYLQDLADECIQNHLRSNLYEEITNSLSDECKSYRFKLNTVEYIAYEDDKGRYHVDKIEEVGMYAGFAKYGRFLNQLLFVLNSHTFDCQRIEKPYIS